MYIEVDALPLELLTAAPAPDSQATTKSSEKKQCRCINSITVWMQCSVTHKLKYLKCMHCKHYSNTITLPNKDVMGVE